MLATFGRPWAPTHWPILLAENFVENKVKIRVYRALDWLASISVAKIMGQKLGFWPIILATDILVSQSRAL